MFRKFFTLLLLSLIITVANSQPSENNQLLADRAREIIDILHGTPVSVLTYGLDKLDEEVRETQTWYFNEVKQRNENSIIQIYLSSIERENEMPVIKIRGTLMNQQGEIRRTATEAEESCTAMLEDLAIIPKIYLDEGNKYFSGSWGNSDLSPKYGNITHEQIYEIIYLEARLKHQNSENFFTCGTLY